MKNILISTLLFLSLPSFASDLEVLQTENDGELVIKSVNCEPGYKTGVNIKFLTPVKPNGREAQNGFNHHTSSLVVQTNCLPRRCVYQHVKWSFNKWRIGREDDGGFIKIVSTKEYTTEEKEVKLQELVDQGYCAKAVGAAHVSSIWKVDKLQYDSSYPYNID